jgi:hypothetical protein
MDNMVNDGSPHYKPRNEVLLFPSRLNFLNPCMAGYGTQPRDPPRVLFPSFSLRLANNLSRDLMFSDLPHLFRGWFLEGRINAQRLTGSILSMAGYCTQVDPRFLLQGTVPETLCARKIWGRRP